MKRFFGMMPQSEVEKKQTFKVGIDKLKVNIEAGKNGWTILYAYGSSDYKDIVDTVENNFNDALNVLKSNFSEIY